MGLVERGQGSLETRRGAGAIRHSARRVWEVQGSRFDQLRPWRVRDAGELGRVHVHEIAVIEVGRVFVGDRLAARLLQLHDRVTERARTVDRDHGRRLLRGDDQGKAERDGQRYEGFHGLVVVAVVLLLVVHDVFNTFRAPSGASYLVGLPSHSLADISPLYVFTRLTLSP